MNKDSKQIPFPLRAHHGMCLQFFVGKGYSNSFTENMTNVKEYLETNNPSLSLQNSEDNICKACPSCEGQCTSSTKVTLYDDAVLKRCGLLPGDCISYNYFIKLVQSNILDMGLREKICGDCQWTELCR